MSDLRKIVELRQLVEEELGRDTAICPCHENFTARAGAGRLNPGRVHLRILIIWATSTTLGHCRPLFLSRGAGSAGGR